MCQLDDTRVALPQPQKANPQENVHDDEENCCESWHNRTDVDRPWDVEESFARPVEVERQLWLEVVIKHDPFSDWDDGTKNAYDDDFKNEEHVDGENEGDGEEKHERN